jgi:hypothetical protein
MHQRFEGKYCNTDSKDNCAVGAIHHKVRYIKFNEQYLTICTYTIQHLSLQNTKCDLTSAITAADQVLSKPSGYFMYHPV